MTLQVRKFYVISESDPNVYRMYIPCTIEKRCVFYIRVMNIMGHVSPCRLAQYVHHTKMKITPFFYCVLNIDAVWKRHAIKELYL